MKHSQTWDARKRAGLATALTIFIGLVVSSAAKEKKQGAELRIQTKDARAFKAELLAVKGRRLILMDALTLSEVEIGIDDVCRIRVFNKSTLFRDMGRGLVIGGIGGAGIGFLSGDDRPGILSFLAEQNALAGGISFGILGAAIGGISKVFIGSDEFIEMGGRSLGEIEDILKKLDRRARFPQGLPRDAFTAAPKPERDTGGSGIRNELPPPKANQYACPSSQKSGSAKFSRLHLTYRPGSFRTQGANRIMSLFEEIGFGDTKPAHEIYFLWISFGTAPAVDYPKMNERSATAFEDFRVDYSITRNFAVGVGYSALGRREVDGYKYIPIPRSSYYSELYLHEDLQGDIYYLLFSWMPVPDHFLRNTTFLLGAGAGLNQSQIRLTASRASYEDNPERKAISKNALALIGTAEINYFFNRHWSLGLSGEYRYAPVKVAACQLDGSYYDLDESKNLIVSTVSIDIPGHTVNSGGFRFGLNAGFHF